MNSLGYFLAGLLIGMLITKYFFGSDVELLETTSKTEVVKGVESIDTLVSKNKETFGFKEEEIKEEKIQETFGFRKEDSIKTEKLLVSENETDSLKKYVVSKTVNDVEVKIEIFSVSKPKYVLVNVIAPVREITITRIDTIKITNTKIVKVGPSFKEKATYAGIGASLMLLLVLL